MAIDAFCKIDTIPSESTEAAYKDWFRVESMGFSGQYSWDAVTRQSPAQSTADPVSLSKLIDKSSPMIIQVLLTKAAVKNVILEILDDHPTTGKRDKRLTYTFEECRIVSVNQSPVPGMQESLTVAYRILKIDDHFTKQKMQYSVGDVKK
jgi:type VI protein secretion system component Hcp